MIAWILLTALVLVYSISLPPLLKRAGLNSAIGYIPLVNFIPMLKMLKRPWYWFFVILCPGINLMMIAVLNVETGIAFGKRSTKDQWMFGLLPWWAFFQLAFKEKELPYLGPRDWTGKKKTMVREWSEALLFAVIAASAIRTFFFEAFTIPTPSMEKSMLVGDYLFVSKMSYGPKVPQTPLSVPFLHNALPGGMTNSYTEAMSLPYFRLPGFGSVERLDPVVFNFPHGDTIMVDPFYAGHDYYSYLRKEAIVLANGYDKYAQNPERYEHMARNNFAIKKVCQVCGFERSQRNPKPLAIGGIRYRPMDKRENYVKRCVGLPGDELSIINRQVHINGQPQQDPEGVMQSYRFTVKSPAALKKIYAEFKVNINDRNSVPGGAEPVYQSSFTASDYEKLKGNSDVLSIEVNNDTLPESFDPQALFPNSPLEPFNKWTRDNFGPIHIPAKGETVALTPENIALYRRVIQNYENNTLQIQDGKAIINGSAAESYTFKQNYYWMMGDNRHQSADSRYWGFVPEDHIVGKPVFTWMSKEDPNYQETGELRWKRMFRFVD
ncbi:MAG: S26 family signal peptidase [Flavobacteriales bacterium]